LVTRNGTDTIIGVIPGSDMAAQAGAHTGDLYKALKAFQTWAGWTTEPALGDYTYPSGSNETFDFQRGSGAATPSWRSYAIPTGKTIADVHSGACDAVWTTRAQNMVATGQGNGFYFPGYEGNGKNFSGAALYPQSDTNYGKVINGTRVVGEVEWAYAVSRQIRVMRAVSGWNCWVGINFSVTNANKSGLNAALAYSSITEHFNSVDMDIYDTDDFGGTFSAPTDAAKTWAWLLTQLTDQKAVATTYGVPLGLGEFGCSWRSDGHGGGDRIAVLQNLQAWILDPANNVSHAFLFNGSNLPGDCSRFAWPTKTTDGGGINSYTYVDTTTQTGSTPTGGFPNVAAAVKTLFDPALFVNKTPTVAVLQAQVANLTSANTALAAQVASLQAQITAGGGTSGLTLRQLLAQFEAQQEAAQNTNATALATAQAQVTALQTQQATQSDVVTKLKAALNVVPTP
jgi:hypothetical protein